MTNTAIPTIPSFTHYPATTAPSSLEPPRPSQCQQRSTASPTGTGQAMRHYGFQQNQMQHLKHQQLHNVPIQLHVNTIMSRDHPCLPLVRYLRPLCFSHTNNIIIGYASHDHDHYGVATQSAIRSRHTDERYVFPVIAHLNNNQRSSSSPPVQPQPQSVDATRRRKIALCSEPFETRLCQALSFILPPPILLLCSVATAHRHRLPLPHHHHPR